MASKELNVVAVPAINVTAKSNNTETAGAIIDTHGYRKVKFVLHSGAMTSGHIVPSILEGDAANLAGGTACEKFHGTIADATFTKVGSTDDANKVKTLGYRGHRRYVKLSATGVGTAATGTATLGTGLAADEKITIEGHDFVFKAEPSAADEVLLGETLAESATNLADAINASETEGIAGAFTASAGGAGGAVVTVSSVALGTGGNSKTFAKTGAHITVSGSGTLTGAVDCVGTISAVCILEK